MKALLIANGVAPNGELIQKHLADSDIVIAADGGIKTLKKFGAAPDYLIGDFDSVSYKSTHGIDDGKTQTIQFPKEKNETDGMIAVNVALEKGADTIVLLGALGKRTDHAIANIMLLQYAQNRGAHLIIEDEYCEVQIASGKYTISGQKGQTVSLLPFSGSATVTADDALYYPLDHLFLSMEDPVGISNIMRKDTADIFIEGTVLVFKIIIP